MQNFASVKTLMKVFSIDSKTARNIRGVVKGTIDPESFPKTAEWSFHCYHKPWDSSLKMSAINELLDMFGVEGIGGGDDWHNGYAPAYSYCNTGDSYAATILYEYRTGRFFIGSWGDIVERHPKLFK